MVTGFKASETLTPRHDRLCARCSSIVRFRSCADDSVGAASNYGKAIQSFKDQGVHDPAYVRTLLAPGAGEVQAGNVAKARSLFIVSVEAAVKVISFFCCVSLHLPIVEHLQLWSVRVLHHAHIYHGLQGLVDTRKIVMNRKPRSLTCHRHSIEQCQLVVDRYILVLVIVGREKVCFGAGP